MKLSAALLGLGFGLVASPLLAGEVTLTKSHICCPGCVKAIEETLEKVEGVSEVSVDKDAKSVTFQATDAKIARKGVRALAGAGFGGEAKHDGKMVKLPAPKIEADAKANDVKVTKLHLCCGACVKAVEGALTSVDGVETAKCDKDKGSCSVTGKDVSLVKVLEALQEAGFHGNIPGQNPEGAKGKKKKKNTDT